MRAVVQDRYGTPQDVLRVAEVPRPQPTGDQVLVRVEAAAVAGDWHLMAGWHCVVRPATGLLRPRRRIPGREIAGVVETTGPGARHLLPGDEVFGWGDGGLAEFAAVPEGQLALKPSSLSLVEAAVVPVSGFTALQALRDAGGLRARQRVLVVGGSGVVGTFAVQIAKALGAEVTALQGPGGRDLVRELGADHVLDHTRDDIADGPTPFDVVLDLVGARPPADYRRALWPDGPLVLVGCTGGRVFKGTGRLLRAALLNPLVRQRLRVLVHRDDVEDLRTLARFADEGRLRPVVSAVYPRRWTTRAGLASLGAAVSLSWTVAMGLGMVRAAPEHSTLDPASVPYAQPGPRPVGVRDLVVPGERPLHATVWYPAATDEGERATYRYTVGMLSGTNPVTLGTYPGTARRGTPADTSAGPFPLVVLSPGFALGQGAYGWLAEHLAGRGLIVIAPDHAETLDPSKLWQATVDRPRDLRAVIDHVATGDDTLSALVDPDRIAVAGHSYGGYAAQVLGGARLDTRSLHDACADARRPDDAGVFLCDALQPHLADMAARAGLPAVPQGLWPDWSDDRVDAVVSMAGDAVMFGAPGLRSLRVPVAALGGTADQDTPYATGARLTFDHTESARAVQVGLVGAQHFAFTGPCASARRVMTVIPFGFCDDPAWNRATARDVIAQYVTAFLLAELSGAETAAALSNASGSGAPVEKHSRGYHPNHAGT